MNLKGITATATLSLPNISKDFITRSIPVILYEALTEAAFPVLEDYSSNLQKLIECLKGYCLSAMDRLRGCFGDLLWSFSFLSGAARGKAKYKLYWKASVCYNKRSIRLFVIAQL